ncbi:ribokinase [uncultured Paraglaciecola sp.]|uniref:ribokinase n=1 Tax=uncultured Paraglaciecola sp. TaxID=1765024 RepID=UPI0030D9255E|tara:strand:- start:6944 stop:7915 length:972 start_codon:yes stop_codon:yes gene_type:complete
MKNTQNDNLVLPVKVIVVGSINCDLTTYLTDFPLKNQTVMAKKSTLSIGGKGVNQAIAAAKDGANVSFIGCIGDDLFASDALNYLRSHQINTDNIRSIENESTGTASILVTDQRENIIAVAPGANSQLTIEDVYKAEALISQADVVIVQLEIPADVVKATLELSRKYHVLSVLNPAPAADYAKSLYSLADIVTPNETEAAELTGIDVKGNDGVVEAANIMLSEGVKQVVITLGEKGSYIASNNTLQFIPPFIVEALDPTGAGDVFNGVLATAIARKLSFTEAVLRASAAAALSVIKPLAQDAAPDHQQINQFLQTTSTATTHF